MASPYKNAKSWNPATVRIAKKYSQPVRPAQAKFATGLSSVVKKFIDVNNPKRKRRM
jgi:hypothetical protein